MMRLYDMIMNDDNVDVVDDDDRGDDDDDDGNDDDEDEEDDLIKWKGDKIIIC